MATETQYKVFCSEEQTYYTAWFTGQPISCPNNYRHSIDPSKTVRIATRPKAVNLVHIQEENTLTNGNFRYETFTWNCPANCTCSNDIVFKYPVNILTSTTVSGQDHIGDSLNVTIIPKNPIVGITVSNISPGDSNIYVSTAVLNYMHPGYQCILDNENLGEVYNVNINSNMITTQYAASNNYVYPSYIKLNIPIIKNLKFVVPMLYNVGAGKIGASYVPTGTVMKTLYTNNSSNEKEFAVNIEYLY